MKVTITQVHKKYSSWYCSALRCKQMQNKLIRHTSKDDSNFRKKLVSVSSFLHDDGFTCMAHTPISTLRKGN